MLLPEQIKLLLPSLQCYSLVARSARFFLDSRFLTLIGSLFLAREIVTVPKGRNGEQGIRETGVRERVHSGNRNNHFKMADERTWQIEFCEYILSINVKGKLLTIGCPAFIRQSFI